MRGVICPHPTPQQHLLLWPAAARLFARRRLAGAAARPAAAGGRGGALPPVRRSAAVGALAGECEGVGGSGGEAMASALGLLSVPTCPVHGTAPAASCLHASCAPLPQRVPQLARRRDAGAGDELRRATRAQVGPGQAIGLSQTELRRTQCSTHRAAGLLPAALQHTPWPYQQLCPPACFPAACSSWAPTAAASPACCAWRRGSGPCRQACRGPAAWLGAKDSASHDVRFCQSEPKASATRRPTALALCPLSHSPQAGEVTLPPKGELFYLSQRPCEWSSSLGLSLLSSRLRMRGNKQQALLHRWPIGCSGWLL